MIDQALELEQFGKEQCTHNKERLGIDDNNSNSNANLSDHLIL